MLNSYNPYIELHSRAAIPIEAPALISVIAFMIDNNENKEKTLKAVKDLLKYYKVNGYELKDANIDSCKLKDANIDSIYLDLFRHKKCVEKDGKNHCILQEHTSLFIIKFFKYSISDKKEKDQIIFDWSAINPEIGLKNEDFIFKTHVRIEKLDTNEPKKDYFLRKTFNNKIKDEFMDLLCSKVSDGGAIIWTPFNSIDNGFNQILIRDISLSPARLGRLVHRVIEIDLYSFIALQDIIKAEKQIIELNGIENNISKMLDNINDAAIKNRISTEDYQKYCHATFQAATSTIQKVSEKRDKFQQAVSYAKIVWRRVEELREERFEGYTRIGFFLERRLRPCIRTCEIALIAQKAVSQEIQGAASLLQTGLILKTQEQEHKIKKVVEFIALFAITYYISYIIIKIIPELHKISWIKWIISNYMPFYSKIYKLVFVDEVHWLIVSPIVWGFLIAIYLFTIKYSKKFKTEPSGTNERTLTGTSK